MQLAFDLAEEIWLPIPGFPGYSVSDLGRVRSDRRKRVLALQVSDRGYQFVFLTRDGKRHFKHVHQLVLRAHVGEPPPGCECLHGKNGKTDNRLGQIRWGTHRQNCDEINYRRGEQLHNAKLTEAQALEIKRQLAAGVMGKILAQQFGVTHRTISNIKLGIQWRHIHPQAA